MSMNFNCLIADVKMFRLKKDLDLIAKGLEENTQDQTEEKNFFKKLGKNVSNSVKKSKSESLEKNKKADEEAVEKIKSVYSSVIEEEAKLKEELSGYLSSEDAKAAFAISYLLADEHEYKEDDETLEEVSKLLYQDGNKLKDVKKDVNSRYNKIVNGLFSSLKNSDVLQLAMQGYLSTFSKVGKGKFAYESAKEAIDGLVGKDEDKKEAILFCSILLMGKKGTNFSKDETGREAFFQAKKETVQASLALRSYLFSVNKKDCNDEEIKDAVKAILSSLSQLSYTLQVKMILEKVDQDNAKEKGEAINNFISLLADMMK